MTVTFHVHSCPLVIAVHCEECLLFTWLNISSHMRANDQAQEDRETWGLLN